MSCPFCKSNKTKVDDASGLSVCINCGLMDANRIVSEVAFAEASGGKTVVQGSSDISNLAHAAHLPESYRDAAQRYYNLAVVHQFTRNRRSDFVAAVCRAKKSSHMLIDFSDVLQVNVFRLSVTFLKLCRVLNLTLPLIDPSLYISRFAIALDFDGYTERVTQDAVKIAQSMDRDWITSGRSPSGISGACLLFAAQSTQLPVSDFRTVWLENCEDPPSYQNKKGESSRSLEAGGSKDDHESNENKDTDVDDESDEEETPTPGKRKRKINDVSTAPSKRMRLKKKEEATAVKRKRDVNDTVAITSKRIALKKTEETVTGKRKRNDSSQNDVSNNKEEEVEKRPVKRNKGKAVDRSSQQNVYYVIPNSEDELLSDDEVVGTFVDNQFDSSEVENDVPEDEATENTKAIADEMEQWLDDKSINGAAFAIEISKHACYKTGDEEDDDDDKDEDDDKEEENDYDKEEEDDDDQEEENDVKEEDDDKEENDDTDDYEQFLRDVRGKYTFGGDDDEEEYDDF